MHLNKGYPWKFFVTKVSHCGLCLPIKRKGWIWMERIKMILIMTMYTWKKVMDPPWSRLWWMCNRRWTLLEWPPWFVKHNQNLRIIRKKMMIIQAKHHDNKRKGTKTQGWQQWTRLGLTHNNSYKDKPRRNTRKMSHRNKNTKPKMLKAWCYLRF